MKKLAVICLLLTAVGLSACSRTSKIPPLAQISNLSDQQLTKELNGFSIEEIHSAFGEPDGHTFGFWSDIYHFPDSHKVAFLYYDTDGYVDTVKTDDRNE